MKSSIPFLFVFADNCAKDAFILPEYSFPFSSSTFLFRNKSSLFPATPIITSSPPLFSKNEFFQYSNSLKEFSFVTS